MNPEILKLKPQNLWKNFAKLNAVPRASKKEERVIAFMKEFGKNLGLETFEDEVGNVIIKKPATSGMDRIEKLLFYNPILIWYIKKMLIQILILIHKE